MDKNLLIMQGIWILLIIIILCSAYSLENSNRKTAMIVELDVFSGRPNPTWILSAKQTEELLEALQNLPLSDKPSPEGGLGYRGFIIYNTDQAGGLPPHIRIYSGIVTMTDGRVQSYRDVHNIEHRLLLQASQQGYKAIVDSMLEGKREK
jgi:hypothetical protein